MNVAELFREFKSKGYLKPFVQFTIFFGILLTALMLPGNSWQTSFIVGPVAAMLTGLFMGILAFWYEEYELRRLRAKRSTFAAFKPLRDAGFQKHNDVLEGFYNGYYGCAYWTEGNPFSTKNNMSYSVRIVFNFSGDVILSRNEIEDFRKNDQIIWHLGMVEGVLNSGRTKLPNQGEIINMANRLTYLLKQLKLSSK